MRLSVWCSEEMPFADPSIIERETDSHPEVRGLSPAVFDASICAIWGVRPMTKKENLPVKSDIPVLLMSGEYDNETPPKWAKGMLKNLSNSYHLIFKGWKHTLTTNWEDPCAMEAANAFFNNPHQIPDPDCFKEIETPFFKIK